MKKSFLVLVICLFLGTVNNVFALTYSESVNGELGSTWSNAYSSYVKPDIGQLESGDNTVSGTMGTSDQDDSFYFTLSDGMKLTGIRMDFFLTDYSDNGDSFKMAKTWWDLRDKAGTIYFTAGAAGIDMLGNNSHVFTKEDIDITPGNYEMANGIGYMDNDPWMASYTLHFQVNSTAAPIPEPTTILLLGTGLVGLAIIARKKMEK